MMKRTAAFTATLLLSIAMAAAPADAVVGPSAEGSPITGSIVMVLNRIGRDAGFCTGVVLTPTVVMTAAHCAPPGADLRVHYPASNQAPVLLPVGAVTRHPDYHADAIRARQRSIDLALIRLPAALPAGFTSALLADESSARIGDRFTLSGYGLGREGDAASSGRLRSATLTARAPLSSVLLWADDPEGRGAGACTGDSGAPLTRAGGRAILGLAVWSAGTGAKHCGTLTQALWIAPLRPWIDGILREWQSSR